MSLINHTLWKYPILAKWPQTTKMGLCPDCVEVNVNIFFLEEFWCVRTRRNFYIEISGPVEYSTTHFLGWPTTEKSKKSIFFQNCLKFDLNGFRYRFRVQNGSKTPQGLISGHISIFQTLPATLKNFEFLAKIVILTIFDDSHYGHLLPIICPEVAGNGFSGPPGYFYIP